MTVVMMLWQVWEAAAQVVKDEEAAKQKLCDDLNQLVQILLSFHFPV